MHAILGFIIPAEATIVDHLLGHPRHLATSIFEDRSVRKLRKFDLKSLGDKSGKHDDKGGITELGLMDFPVSFAFDSSK